MKTQATSLDAVRPMSFNSVEQRMSPISSLGESLSRAGARFGCFGRATLGPDVGIERTEELLGGLRDPFNGNKENCFVGFARLVEAGDFPDELQGSSANLVTRHGRFKVEKSFDISTHDYPSYTRKITILAHQCSPGGISTSLFHALSAITLTIKGYRVSVSR
jgi:hypothetical protein